MHLAPHKSYTRQQGLSLIEVMIALLIGIILLSGAVSIFISNNAAANLGSQLSRMQDNGRLLIDVLSRDIRMAGYSGCTSRGNVTPNAIALSPPLLPFNNDSSVQGYNAVGGSWAPALSPNIRTVLQSLSHQVHVGTDILVVQHADECVAHVAQQTSASPIIVHFPHTCDIAENRPLMVSDCNATDVFQSHLIADDAVNSRQSIAYNATQNSGANLSTSYDTDAIVSVPLFSIFYIGRHSDFNNPEPLSLYMLRWEPNGNSIHESGDYRNYELANGVQDMQILYGEDVIGTLYADRYQPADAVTDWLRIRSVRINLLLRSTNNTTSEPQPFIFNGVAANPSNDRRLRFAFSTTVSLRNRLP